MAIDVGFYYRSHGAMVLRRCRKLLRDEARAEDAMHDVFVELLRRQEVMVDEAPSSLLYRIATNVCLNRLRSQRRRPEDADEDLLGRIADSGGEPGFTRVLLGRLLGGEQESTRTMAVLHLLDGMTLEEVAAETRLSVSGVRKRLRGLKERVRELEEI